MYHDLPHNMSPTDREMMAIEGLKVWGLILLHVLTHYCCVKAGKLDVVGMPPYKNALFFNVRFSETVNASANMFKW